MEADVFLVKDAPLVAHSALDLRPERTLEKLYLDPLRERIKANGGRVYKGGPTIWLLVDVKSEAKATYQALDKVFARYDDILSVIKDGHLDKKAITVVISGNRASADIAAQKIRYAGIDGRPSDVDSKKPADLIPWISDNWSNTFRWRGKSAFAEEERAKLKELVRKSHEAGRLVRFWGTPEDVNFWAELRAADVDLINTDKLEQLKTFLLADTKQK